MTAPDGQEDQIQLRRDTTADWASVNPVLAAGEPGFDYELGVLKIGDGTSTWSELPSFMPGISAPQVLTRTSGDIVLANTGVTWTDLDPDGSVASRPLDVVFLNAEAGQKATVGINAGVSAAAVALSVDLTIVDGAGATIRRASGTAAGVPTWGVNNVNAIAKIVGDFSFVIQEGDIVGGQVRARVQYVKNSATARTVFAGAATYPLQIEGRGPFG